MPPQQPILHQKVPRETPERRHGREYPSVKRNQGWLAPEQRNVQAEVVATVGDGHAGHSQDLRARPASGTLLGCL